MTETESLMALNAINGLGNARVKCLLEHFHTAENVFIASKREFSQVRGIPSDVINKLSAFNVTEFLCKESELMKRHHVHVVSIYDRQYPEMLKEIPDAPLIIYVKGQGAWQQKAFAIVGARKCSFYGQQIAEKIARELAEVDFNIISGMARGIDTFAHIGALKARGQTVAVMGCGLAHVYPLENKELMQEIEENGCIISEFPMLTFPYSFNFPRRNRIISGLSLGVLVVEASKRSGALITADFALEQGREVFAIPGRMDSPFAKGTNNLIRQGAKIVTNIEDILEEFSIELKERNFKEGDLIHEESNFDLSISDEEKDIYRLIGNTPQHIDEIASKKGDDLSKTASILLQLELKRLVKALPGKIYKQLGKQSCQKRSS